VNKSLLKQVPENVNVLILQRKRATTPQVYQTKQDAYFLGMPRHHRPQSIMSKVNEQQILRSV